MGEKIVGKSFFDQIIDETLTRIEELEEFDMRVIKGLRYLAESGELKKEQKVAEVIKTPREEPHENTCSKLGGKGTPLTTVPGSTRIMSNFTERKKHVAHATNQ